MLKRHRLLLVLASDGFSDVMLLLLAKRCSSESGMGRRRVWPVLDHLQLLFDSHDLTVQAVKDGHECHLIIRLRLERGGFELEFDRLTQSHLSYLLVDIIEGLHLFERLHLGVQTTHFLLYYINNVSLSVQWGFGVLGFWGLGSSIKPVA